MSPGAGRRAQGETGKTKRPRSCSSGAGAKAAAARARIKAPRLLTIGDLRPGSSGLPQKKRRQCPDCRFCQGCSQDRCRLCRGKRKPQARRLSVTEQIALYEKINRPKGRKPASKTGVGPRS